MSNSAEKLKSHIAKAEIEGDTLKISTSVHFVAQTEESRRKKREIHADRATIARARERSFGGRMWHGLTETYQRLHTRDQLRSYHDEVEDIASESAAFNQAKAQIDTLRASEKEEAEALALKTNILPDISTRDRLFLASEETAGSASQKRIISQARKLVSGFTLGQIDEATLESRADTIVKLWRRELARGQYKFYGLSEIGSDIVQVAKTAREAYLENQKPVKGVDVDLEVYFGRINSGFATQEKRDLADKVIDWSQDSRKRSLLVNPLTIGLGASAGAFAIRAPTKTIPVVGGIAGGIFAGVRRWSKENKDRYLKQREEEIGYEIGGPASPGNPVERVLAGVVGQTDFRESSYQPLSALETCERFEEFIEAPEDVKQSAQWQNQTLSLIAEVRERINLSEALEIGLVKFGQRRREDGQIEVTGASTIDRDKLSLIVSAAVAEKDLKEIIGENEFKNRYTAEATDTRNQLLERIAKADAKFKKSRIFKSLRSGGFALGVGIAGGAAIHFAGEGVEAASEKIADAVDDLKEHIIDKVKEKIPLGDGKFETITVATKDTPGFKIEVPEGYSHQIDAANHLVVLDGKDGHFEIPYSDYMSEGQVKLALESAGIEGKVTMATAIIGEGAHSVQQEILKPDYLASHQLTEITNQNFHFNFGHADILEPGKHDYNELTLYQHTGVDWSIGPQGLNGSPISPFVFKDEPAWADPAIVQNAPVNPHDFVTFYQVADETGKWHTILAPKTNGHFQLPNEFVDPATGKVDGVGIIGYGMVRDANGHIIPADQVLANPDLINSGTLYSVASIPLEQKSRIMGEQFPTQTLQIEDLVATTQKPIDTFVDRFHDFDIDIPPLATPFAPRIFPEVATKKRGFGYYGLGGLEDYRRWMSEHQITPDPYNKSPNSESWVNGEGNPVVRDVQRERAIVSDHLSSQEPDYRAELEVLAKGLPVMDEKTRVVVVIPARLEGRNLRHLLESYTKQVDLKGQSLDPSIYEINILINRKERELSDDSMEEIRSFQESNPQFKVVVIEKVFSPEKGGVGVARKYATDLALLRSIQRENQVGPLYIESEDADLVKVDLSTVIRLIEKFDSYPHLDALRGTQDKDISVLSANDLLLFDTRSFNFAEILFRSRKFRPEDNPNWHFVWNRIVTGGWNTAFTAEIYAQIGGYDSALKTGEDLDIGHKISMLRGTDGNPNLETIGRVASRTQSSPRRSIQALAEHIDPYDPVNFDNQTLKKYSDRQLLQMLRPYARITEENKGEFERVATLLRAFVRSVLVIESDSEVTFRRIMGYCGFKDEDYEIIDGEVKIKKITNIKQVFERFRERTKQKTEKAKIEQRQREEDERELVRVRQQLRETTEARATPVEIAPVNSKAADEQKKPLREWLRILARETAEKQTKEAQEAGQNLAYEVDENELTRLRRSRRFRDLQRQHLTKEEVERAMEGVRVGLRVRKANAFPISRFFGLDLGSELARAHEVRERARMASQAKS